MIAMLWFSLGTSPQDKHGFTMTDRHKAYYCRHVIPWLWCHYIRYIDGTQSQSASSGQHLTLYLTWHVTHPETQFAVQQLLHCHTLMFNVGSLPRLETSGDCGPFRASVSGSNARKRLLTLHITKTDTGLISISDCGGISVWQYRESWVMFFFCWNLLWKEEKHLVWKYDI